MRNMPGKTSLIAPSSAVFREMWGWVRGLLNEWIYIVIPQQCKHLIQDQLDTGHANKFNVGEKHWILWACRLNDKLTNIMCMKTHGVLVCKSSERTQVQQIRKRRTADTRGGDKTKKTHAWKSKPTNVLKAHQLWLWQGQQLRLRWRFTFVQIKQIRN